MKAKFNLRAMLLVFVVVVCLFAFQLSAFGFAGGTGTPDDPYKIATAEQLVSIGSNSNLLDKHFVLLNDIDLNPNLPGGQIFTRAVIAPNMESGSLFDGIAFTGGFDGKGHKIKNLHIHAVAEDYIGLFGYVEKNANIRNLGIENVSITGSIFIGGLAGYSDATINNCYVTGSISGGYDCGCVGGLIGLQYWDSMTVNCRAFGIVSAGDESGSMGGLVGANIDGIIVNCRADMDVSGGDSSGSLGGLVGCNMGTISYCYSSGDVSGGDNSWKLGGLVGVFGNWEDDIDLLPLGKIANSCATGNVSAGDESSYIGGLVGRSRLTVVANCYASGAVTSGHGSSELNGLIDGGSLMVASSFWDKETSGLDNSEGGTGLTTAQMQEIQTFLDAGWDFAGERENGTAELWSIPEGGGYPVPGIFSNDFQRRTLSGSGTPEYPYQIATAEDLGAINHYNLAACYKLTADIDLAGITWLSAPVLFLDGKFDGSGHTISNLTIRGAYDLALFGILGNNASIVDLGVTDANINGIVEYGVNIAALTGWSMGEATRCYATGSVTGGDNAWSVGGLVGDLYPGTINDCYSMVTVSVGEDSVCIGGLVGVNSGSVTTSYSTGTVFSGRDSGHLGGLVGMRFDGTVMNSFWDIQTSETEISDGGTGLNTNQMKRRSSYSGWDFDDIWMICEGVDYPRLQWQNIQCGQ